MKFDFACFAHLANKVNEFCCFGFLFFLFIIEINGYRYLNPW